MKFISFNINGLRARPHQLEAIIEKYQPDVIGLQEIKVAYEISGSNFFFMVIPFSSIILWYIFKVFQFI